MRPRTAARSRKEAPMFSGPTRPSRPLNRGSSADDPRFKGLLGRVGPENIGASFLDLAAVRGLIEPIAQQALPADKWAYYTKEIQPYLKPLDALISAIRKDGGLDRGSGA